MAEDLEARVAVLERQVDLLRRALTLLTITGRPTREWLDAEWKKKSKPTKPKVL